MPALPVRILVLLVVGWTSIYCCCDAPAQVPSAEQATAKICCAQRHSSAPSPSDHRMPDGRKCDECPYFAIRQNTLISDTQHVSVAPLSLCVIAAPIEVLAAPLSIGRAPAIDWSDPIKIPTGLLDLHTSLLR